MATGPAGSAVSVRLNLTLEGMEEKDQSPAITVYAFDATGQFLTSAPVEASKTTLVLPPQTAGQTVRFYAGPPIDAPTIATLSQKKAVEFRSRLDPKGEAINWTIADPEWRPWLLCTCVVRGRLVKRLALPDGTTKELPICHSRVTICEVFEIPRLIYRLPDDLIRRLRDEFIAVITSPFPPPPPGDPFRATSLELASGGGTARPVGVGSRIAGAAVAAAEPQELRMQDAGIHNKVRALAAFAGMEEIRRGLVEIAPLLSPYFCWWPWLEPFLVVNCVRTVPVDENGRFQATLWYPCILGAPNIYLKAEQHHGMTWEWIYRPSVHCTTYWRYSCGTEVVLNVTDPSAVACAPSDPVVPPAGVGTWVMPFAVGGTKVWGTPLLIVPTPSGWPAGWVQSNGLTDYGEFVHAPFGGFLGFRHGWSLSIPSGAIKYYRWRYRKAGTAAWFDAHEPVVRHYVKQAPAVLPTFPVCSLGPHTIGEAANLYEFKPPAPPGPEMGDPAGTITYWPTDDFFGDIYTGYLDTPSLPPSVFAAAGQYQIKLEVFDPLGTQVMPGPAFSFIVPRGLAFDGVTVLTRSAEAGEIDNGGFVFNLHIDNNHCTASIEAPHLGTLAAADDCGFLRYNPIDPTPVTIAFHARHPNTFARFGFSVVRGANAVATASTSGEVSAVASGSYAGDGAGNFSHAFARVDLLGSCINGAFAEDLHVFAKATTGWGNPISAFDASALRAFALAPIGP